MEKMEHDDEEEAPIEPSSLEYIEDSYVPNIEFNATPSLDDLAAYDDDCDLDDIYNENVTWSKETDLFLRSLTLDQILTMPDDELSVIDENIEMQTVEISHIENNNSNVLSGGRSFIESTKNKWRLLTKRKMRDVRVTFVDLSKPYILKISSSDNYKKFLSIGDGSGKLSDASPTGSVSSATEAINDFANLSLEEQERQREEWKQELSRVEEEIQTLRTVLASKIHHSTELKRKLGITVWKEITEDVSSGIKNVRESNVYQTVEQKVDGIKHAVVETPIYHKTESVIKSTANATSSLFSGFTNKISQMKNSDSFKSFEERVGGAYESVKTKVSTSRSGSIQSFNDIASTNNTAPTTPIHEEKPLA